MTLIQPLTSTFIYKKFTKYLTLMMLSLVFYLHSPQANATLITTFINEIHYDNVGTDHNEFIEIASLISTDIRNWTMQLYNGTNGKVYNSFTLDSFNLTNPSNGFAFMKIDFPSNGIQNGINDGIALFDQNNQLIQFLSYEGSLTATDGLAQGYTSVDIGVQEYSNTPENFSLQLSGVGNSYQDFSWQNAAIATANTINHQQSFTNINAIIPPSIQVNEPKNINWILFTCILYPLYLRMRSSAQQQSQNYDK